MINEERHPAKGPLHDQRVVVTGATGLVGGFVVEELLKRGAHVIALVRDTIRGSHFESSGLAEKCTLVHGKLEDAELVLRLLNEYQTQGVIHLAAQTQVRVANENPIPTFKANIEGSWNILEAARQCRKHLRFFVVASSDKAYGEPLTHQYDETHPLQGRYPYDVSKSCTDLIAQSYAITYKLPICITRCGNFFGPGDLNWDRLIPHVINSFLQRKSPQIRSNGKLVRDYFYVKDGAKAYVFLAEKMLEQGEKLMGESFNFSYGLEFSVDQIVEMLARKMKCEDLLPTILNEAAHEISFQSLSPKKARKELQWEPSYAIETGLEETINWYRERA